MGEKKKKKEVLPYCFTLATSILKNQAKMKFFVFALALCASVHSIDISSIDVDSLGVGEISPILIQMMTSIKANPEKKIHTEAAGMLTLLNKLKVRLENEGKGEAEQMKFAKETLALFKDEVTLKDEKDGDEIAVLDSDLKERNENIVQQMKLIATVRELLANLVAEKGPAWNSQKKEEEKTEEKKSESKPAPEVQPPLPVKKEEEKKDQPAQEK